MFRDRMPARMRQILRSGLGCRPQMTKKTALVQSKDQTHSWDTETRKGVRVDESDLGLPLGGQEEEGVPAHACAAGQHLLQVPGESQEEQPLSEQDAHRSSQT